MKVNKVYFFSFLEIKLNSTFKALDNFILGKIVTATQVPTGTSELRMRNSLEKS